MNFYLFPFIVAFYSLPLSRLSYVQDYVNKFSNRRNRKGFYFVVKSWIEVYVKASSRNESENPGSDSLMFSPEH